MSRIKRLLVAAGLVVMCMGDIVHGASSQSGSQIAEAVGCRYRLSYVSFQWWNFLRAVRPGRWIHRQWEDIPCGNAAKRSAGERSK